MALPVPPGGEEFAAARNPLILTPQTGRVKTHGCCNPGKWADGVVHLCFGDTRIGLPRPCLCFFCRDRAGTLILAS